MRCAAASQATGTAPNSGPSGVTAWQRTARPACPAQVTTAFSTSIVVHSPRSAGDRCTGPAAAQYTAPRSCHQQLCKLPARPASPAHVSAPCDTIPVYDSSRFAGQRLASTAPSPYTCSCSQLPACPASPAQLSTASCSAPIPTCFGSTCSRSTGPAAARPPVSGRHLPTLATTPTT